MRHGVLLFGTGAREEGIDTLCRSPGGRMEGWRC